MRLLNIHTLKLEAFIGDIPPFTILSHTWGNDEVTLQDLEHKDYASKAGWMKIIGFCQTVQKNSSESLNYVWVDTCCIDKTSSAELSESINAMFRWYQTSQRCFAYLEDVNHSADDVNEEVGDSFEKSRWFTRGWTLQELIAPQHISFFDCKWRYLGDKQNLTMRLSLRTGIDSHTLLIGDISSVSVAQRMSWAAGRQTTRPEDIAYCLLGIFDISMTMLYGEGDKAFIRLQEEILKEYDDNSIFVWDPEGLSNSVTTIGAFAPHPSFFKNSTSIKHHPSPGNPPAITNKGIQIGLPLIPLSRNRYLGVLSCFPINDIGSAIGIELEQSSTAKDRYSRRRARPIHFTNDDSEPKYKQVYLTKRSMSGGDDGSVVACWLHYEFQIQPGKTYPSSWHRNIVNRTMTLNFGTGSFSEVSAGVIFRLLENGSHFCLVLRMQPQNRTIQVHIEPIEKPIDSDELNDMMHHLMAKPFAALNRIAIYGDKIIAEGKVKLIRGSWMYDVDVQVTKVKDVGR